MTVSSGTGTGAGTGTGIRSLCFASAAMLLLAGLAVGSPRPAVDAWESALRSPLERAGQVDELALEWIDLLAGPLGDDGPPAELILRRLDDLLDGVSSLEPFVARLVALVDGDSLSPRDRAIARDVLADVYRRLGRHEEAEALDPDRGYVLHWAVIGPFGSGARSELGRRFAPESRIDLDREHASRRRTLRWLDVRRKRLARSLGAQYVLAAREGVYYALAQVRSDREREAVARVEGSSPVWLFVNGAPVARESDDEFLAQERGYAIGLAAGWNRLLVKSRGEPFALRLVDPDGRPLGADVLQQEEGLELREQAATRGGPFEASEFPWERTLEAASARRPSDARLALALLWRALGRPDLAVSELEQAIAAAPDVAAARHHAGLVYRGASHLPSEMRRRRARSEFERALELDDGFLPARLEVARFLLQEEQFPQAIETIRRVIDAHPRSGTALGLLLEAYDQLDWDNEAAETARAMAEVAPAAARPHIFLADLAEARDNLAAAVAHLEAARTRAAHRIDLPRKLADIEGRRGRFDAARAHLDAWLELRPDSGTATFALARFLLDRRDFDDAIAVLEERAERFPYDLRGLRELAAAHVEAGRLAEALAIYERILSIEPGDVTSRRVLDSLRDRGIDRFWEPYDEQLEDWLDGIPEARRFPKAGSLAVLDIAVLKVYPDGARSEYTHQALQLLNEAEKDNLARVRTPGEIRLLRTVTPGRETLEPVAATGRSSFVMPGLEPGAIVEFAYLRDSSGPGGRPLDHGSFFFQDFQFRQPMLLSRFVAILPRELSVDTVESALRRQGDDRFARVTRNETDLGDGWRAIVWEARDVPRLDPEPMMPPRDEYLANVSLKERSDRNALREVASSLADRVLGRTRLTPELRRFARETTAGVDDPIERARVLYNEVNRRVRSERGPMDAVGVFLENAGDRGILYKALLDAVDVPSAWAFASERAEVAGRVDLDHPSPSDFRERLVVVDPDGLDETWVSLDARHAPFGKLPFEYHNGRALLLRDGGPAMRSVPPAPPADSVELSEATVTVGSDADDLLGARVALRMTAASHSWYALKPRIEDLDAQRRRLVLQRMASALFPGARIERAELPGIDELGEPFVRVIELTAPRFLQEAGGEFLLRPVVSPAMLVRRYIGIPTRTHPYHLTRHEVFHERLRIECGEHLRVVRVPEGAVHASPLGHYSLRYAVDGDALLIERRLVVEPGRLEVDAFQSFFDFCRRVDEAETERVVLARRAD